MRILKVIMPILYGCITLMLFNSYEFFQTEILKRQEPAVSNITKEITKQIREKYHLDDPLLQRFGRFLLERATMDLGLSYSTKGWKVINVIKPAIFKSLVFPGGLLLVMIGISTIMRSRSIAPPPYSFLLSGIGICLAVVLWLLARGPLIPILAAGLTIMAILIALFNLPTLAIQISGMCLATLGLSAVFSLENWTRLNGLSRLLVYSVSLRDYPLASGIPYMQAVVAVAGTVIFIYAKMLLQYSKVTESTKTD
jgi:ABC-type dipeptide/oligopeptide/nickel transport system permease component